MKTTKTTAMILAASMTLAGCLAHSFPSALRIRRIARCMILVRSF